MIGILPTVVSLRPRYLGLEDSTTAGQATLNFFDLADVAFQYAYRTSARDI